jgi:hypothetical protein
MKTDKLAQAKWFKSSRSNGQDNCVEVATLDRAVALRDSKNPHGPKLIIDAASWRTFTNRIKTGEHDLI